MVKPHILKNKFFGDIIKTEWISNIGIDKKREAEIQSYFSNKTQVHVTKEQDELDSLIQTFKLWSQDDITDTNNVDSFGENKKMDRLIIMDDVYYYGLWLIIMDLPIS